ncbi:MAG: hypothetical protein NC340_01890 [Ruminococcus flavefaciens]|nr:hypothetical protein [Ruminococcus flavefaciens]MCM1228899.1 hypothetical protein [Ruminococcus flavefaciens]
MNIKNFKPTPVPPKEYCFGHTEKDSYKKAYVRRGTVILDSFGEYTFSGFMRRFPCNLYIEDYIERVPYIKKYRIINHLSIAPNVYKEAIVLCIVKDNCRYRLDALFKINRPDFLDILVGIIESTDKYCEEMTAIVMDGTLEEIERDYIPHIKWGAIVNSVDKTAMLIDKDGSAVQFHKRFRLTKHTFLK